MQRIFFLLGLCMALTLMARPDAAAQSRTRPNVIIIMTDDQGFGDLGCYGSPDIRTPNIDRMAAEGMRFTAFYAAPFCAPSRAQLMTGCYPPRVNHARNPVPNSPYGLHPDELTIAEIVKSQGYVTKMVGKWHLGDAPNLMPPKQGFDEYFGTPYSNDMWRYHPKMPPRENEDSLMQATRKRAAYTGFAGQETGWYPPNGGFPYDLPLIRNNEVIEENPDQRQLIKRYTQECLSFIEANKNKPFLLYMAHNMPHVPLFASEDFRGKSLRGLYGDAVMEVDWSVGQILDKLRQLKIEKNTLVIFLSDNGPWLGYGIDGGSAGPLRDGKGSVFEGGMRVPAIFRWPGKIPANKVTSVMAGNLDILPTVARLAGTSAPTDRIIDGRDLWPVLSGQSDRSPHEYIHYHAGSQENKVNYRAIRDERWKLFVDMGADGKLQPTELYDLGRDVAERFNRIKDHPEIADRLRKAAQQFYDELVKNQRPAGRRM